MLKMILPLLALILACKPSETASGHDPVKCETDGDCHPAACGPCTAGVPITQADLIQECVVNPCGDAGAACVNHVCTVQ